MKLTPVSSSVAVVVLFALLFLVIKLYDAKTIATAPPPPEALVSSDKSSSKSYPYVTSQDIKSAKIGLEYPELNRLSQMAFDRGLKDEGGKLNKKAKDSMALLEENLNKYGILYVKLKDDQREPSIQSAIALVMDNKVEFIGGDRGSELTRKTIREMESIVSGMENEVIKMKSR